MPAQPRPARGAGEYTIRYWHEPTHVRATLYRRAATGAPVELGTERVSYPLAQETLARVEGTPGPEELGYVDDVEELGALGRRIKKFARRVAKSKLGKIVKSVGKVATAFVPGGSAITGAAAGIKAAKKGLDLAKSLKKRKKKKALPPPPPEEDLDLAAAEEEVGAAKPKPKAAAKPKPKAAAKPKPKAAAKLKAKKPSATKPTKSAAQKLVAVKAQGGAAATLLKAAAAAETPAKATQAAKLAALVDEIEDSAPELAATLAQLPETDDDERDAVDDRAVAAAKKLAATPAAERAEVAAKIEARLDGYKVVTPEGDTVWVPLEEVG